MENTPKVIFRTVAHNAEKTLRRAIESVFAQTYDNWELHLVNNGSTDGTGAIMEEYAGKDTRIRMFTNEGNYVWKKGNRFTDYYAGYDPDNTYMCYLDADDEYKPEFLREMTTRAVENNLDIACCGYEFVNEKTKQILEVRKVPKAFILEGGDFDLKFPEYHFWMRSRCMKLFKLSVTDKLSVSDDFDMPYGGDTAETLEYFRNAGRVGLYPETYYIYYADTGSVSYRWYDRRNRDDRRIHDLTISFLVDKTGRVSIKNYDFLRSIFLYAVNSTLTVIFKFAQMSAGERLAALHDALVNEHTRKLMDFSSIDIDVPVKSKIAKNVADWIVSNERDFRDLGSLKKASEIMAVITEISENKERTESIVYLAVQDERADSVLEISGFDSWLGGVFKNPQLPLPPPTVTTVDRIDLIDSGSLERGGVYNNVYGSESLSDISRLDTYDVIIVFHLFELMACEDAKELLYSLLTKAGKQVLVITPEFPCDLESEDGQSGAKVYNPGVFRGMDFSHKMFDAAEGRMQAYSFYAWC